MLEHPVLKCCSIITDMYAAPQSQYGYVNQQHQYYHTYCMGHSLDWQRGVFGTLLFWCMGHMGLHRVHLYFTLEAG